MRTIVGVGDPKAVQKYSTFLAVDVGRESYFSRKFMGEGEQAQTPLQVITDLESDAGDKVSYDVVMQLRQKPVEGDNPIEGKGEKLRFYTDSLLIDQARGNVDTGGRMTRKRTIHDMRKIARTRQAEWWARIFDELWFMYLSGARGINPDFTYETSYTGFAGNSFVAPDSNHILYAGSATAKNNLASTDKMTKLFIERLVTKAQVMGGGVQGIPAIQPCKVAGEERYVMVLHPWAEHDLRQSTDWLEIQKALSSAEGRNTPIFQNALGMHRGVVLHSHKGVIRFSDYGAGGNISAVRNLFLGRQAGVIAFGTRGTGFRFDWHEEPQDHGNAVEISTSTIFGMKKTAFTIDGVSRDFGVIAADCAAADPS